ncbi:hypothetical protein NEHOM01_0114 [Nematocida homosporus]|uniref:uncharacterized protein n=1 Tax=Nematocida homosporus TaxID=1912981 RepID=UPI002220D55C|nr:uncharacterized protein NEHOM01_0114 [Nematocida homosporus]KAI5184369.1 hypothetical protein NEHOM01_0114 [Nematocida homosporus]
MKIRNLTLLNTLLVLLCVFYGVYGSQEEPVEILDKSNNTSQGSYSDFSADSDHGSASRPSSPSIESDVLNEPQYTPLNRSEVPNLTNLAKLDFHWPKTLLAIIAETEEPGNSGDRINNEVLAHYKKFAGYFNTNPTLTGYVVNSQEFLDTQFYYLLFPTKPQDTVLAAAQHMYALFDPSYYKSCASSTIGPSPHPVSLPTTLSIYDLLNITMVFTGFEDGQNLKYLTQPIGPYKTFLDNFSTLVLASLNADRSYPTIFANLLKAIQNHQVIASTPTALTQHLNPNLSDDIPPQNPHITEITSKTLITNTNACFSALQKSHLLTHLVEVTNKALAAIEKDPQSESTSEFETKPES